MIIAPPVVPETVMVIERHMAVGNHRSGEIVQVVSEAWTVAARNETREAGFDIRFRRSDVSAPPGDWLN